MKQKILLISEETLKSYTLINDNLDGKYLLPSIQLAQEIDLENLIGECLLTKLTDLAGSGDIWLDEWVDYKTLLDDYITPYLCWQVMSTIQPSINYKLSNSGVIGNDDTNKSRIDFKNSQLLEQQYKNNANAFAIKMKNYLCANVNKFPEYSKVINYEYAEDVPTYGIYLGDVNIDRSYLYK